MILAERVEQQNKVASEVVRKRNKDRASDWARGTPNPRAANPEAGSSRGRTLPLTVTMPHGCDLKDRTERERMIGEKYLRRWYIVKDV